MRGFGLFIFYIENLDQVRVPMRESVPLYEQIPSRFLEPPRLSIVILFETVYAWSLISIWFHIKNKLVTKWIRTFPCPLQSISPSRILFVSCWFTHWLCLNDFTYKLLCISNNCGKWWPKLFFVHKCIFICYIQMYKLQSTCITRILPMCNNSADAKQRSVMHSLLINNVINHIDMHIRKL